MPIDVWQCCEPHLGLSFGPKHSCPGTEAQWGLELQQHMQVSICGPSC